MTAASTTAPRPTLEELVDRLIDAIFGGQPSTSTSVPMPTTSPARGIHEARRLRQTGDLDGALHLFVELDMSTATEDEQRWAYAEWADLARRRFSEADAFVYSPGSGRAAVLTPCDDGTLEVRAVLRMCWRAGKLVSRRSLRGLKPLGRGGAS